MASKAYDAAMEAMEANSPSKLFRTAGGFVPAGYALGIKSGEREVEDASESMVKVAFRNTSNVISKLVDAINDDIDMQPTIRPVLDLSELKSGANSLNTLFSRNQAMMIAGHISERQESAGQNGVIASSSGPTYQFTQNNYSPKALSRIEIYRQTKNQFSALERVVKS